MVLSEPILAAKQKVSCFPGNYKNLDGIRHIYVSDVNGSGAWRAGWRLLSIDSNLYITLAQPASPTSPKV